MHDNAALFGQRAQSRVQRLVSRLGESGLLEGRGIAVANLAQLHSLAPQTPPEAFALVHRDADEPGAQTLVAGGFALGSGRHGSPAIALEPVAKPRRRFLVELQEHRLHHVLGIGHAPRLVERDAVHHVGVVVDDLSVLAVVHGFPSRPSRKRRQRGR